VIKEGIEAKNEEESKVRKHTIRDGRRSRKSRRREKEAFKRFNTFNGDTVSRFCLARTDMGRPAPSQPTDGLRDWAKLELSLETLLSVKRDAKVIRERRSADGRVAGGPYRPRFVLVLGTRHPTL
jgi:hypothetical protein